MKVGELLSSGVLPEPEAARLSGTLARWRRCRRAVARYREALTKGEIERVESEQRIRQFAVRAFQGSHAPAVAPSRVATRKGGRRKARKDPFVTIVKERMIGPENDMRSIEYFERGLLAARSVGRIDYVGSPWGTGFLVGPQLVLTNNHVIGSEAHAALCSLVMDAEDNTVGAPRVAQTFALDPARFFATDEHLDFTIVAVADRSEAGGDLDRYGSIPLDEREGKALIGQHTNIIQHPGGHNKRVVFRNSRLVYLDNERDSEFLFYESDTGKGSSGSPVFSDRWELIAVHFQSVPRTNADGEVLGKDGSVLSEDSARSNPELIAWEANEGARVSRIVPAIKAIRLSGEKKRIRDAMVKRWSRPVRRPAFAESLAKEHVVGARTHTIDSPGVRIEIAVKT